MKKVISSIAKGIILMSLFSVPSFADSNGASSIELLIGSPYAITDSEVVKIDEEKDNVIPVILNDRTLVPVRFISESFGMEVVWDNAARRVSLANSDYTIEIVIGEPFYSVNGNTVPLDAPATIINERTMLPLRAMAEAIEKKVFWEDGYIFIGNNSPESLSRIPAHKWQLKAGSNEYGVRFKVIEDESTDYYTTCERLGAASGLQVVSENPETEGSSDFDMHYPWSDMRLCSFYRSENGEMTKAYEGEDGFDPFCEYVFVEIPKFYMKRFIEDGYEYRYISEQPKEGFITDPSFIENGRELDYIYVSAYEGGDSGGRLVSGTGLFPMSEKTRPEFIDLAKANGNGFSILDIRTLMTLQNLYLIEFAEKDSQKAIGNGWTMCLQPFKDYAVVRQEKSTNRVIIKNPGKNYVEKFFDGCSFLILSLETNKVLYQRTITDIVMDEVEKNTVSFYFDGSPIDTDTGMYVGSGAQKTGSADSLSHHTGRTDGHGGEQHFLYRTGVRYRNMENLWGNVWHFIDGINIDKGKTVFSVNMNDYNTDSVNYHSHSIKQKLQTDNGNVGGNKEIHYLKNLGYDENYPWLALPCDYTYEYREELEGASINLREGNFGDYYYLNNDTATNYVHGGGFDHYWRCGLFTLRGWQNDKKAWYLYGTRLIYKPLA